MEKSRYVVEYLSEGGSDVESMFIEASSKDEATAMVVDRCGAYTTILSTQLTKSCGGPGTTQTSKSVDTTDSVEVVEDAVVVEKPKKVKKEKSVEVKPKAEKKVTKASQVREKIQSLKAENGTPEQAVTWSIETLGMTKGSASVYVKAIWNE